MIVVWRVLTDCNLACPFCAYDRRLPMPRRAVDPTVVRRTIAALADYRDRTGDPVALSWLGGEPFLWAPLTELTEAAHALGLAVGATTNGTRLGSPALRDHILRRYADLTVSVDAPGERHDRMRAYAGGYAKLGRNVAALARTARATGAPLRLRANVVLMRDTLADFAALCHELADWGITELTFNQLGGRDRPEFHPANRLRPADVAALAGLLPGLRAALAGRMTIQGGDAYLERLHASSLGQPRPVADCDPGRAFLFIDEGGCVAPCAFTGDDYAVPVAGLATGADIAGLAARFRAAARARRALACDDCLSTQACAKFAPAA